MCELRAYPWPNVALEKVVTPYHTSSDVSVDSSKTGKKILKEKNLYQDVSSQEAISFDAPSGENAYLSVDLLQSMFINMVTFLGVSAPLGDPVSTLSDGVELWVGDDPVPTNNIQYGTADRKFELPVNAFGQYVFLRKAVPDAELGVALLMAFSDCDCRGVVWSHTDNVGFPMNIAVGATGQGTLPEIHSLATTETPECDSFDCFPLREELKLDDGSADGAPLPSFMTWDGL